MSFPACRTHSGHPVSLLPWGRTAEDCGRIQTFSCIVQSVVRGNPACASDPEVSLTLFHRSPPVPEERIGRFHGASVAEDSGEGVIEPVESRGLVDRILYLGRLISVLSTSPWTRRSSQRSDLCKIHVPLVFPSPSTSPGNRYVHFSYPPLRRFFGTDHPPLTLETFSSMPPRPE